MAGMQFLAGAVVAAVVRPSAADATLFDPTGLTSFASWSDTQNIPVVPSFGSASASVSAPEPIYLDSGSGGGPTFSSWSDTQNIPVVPTFGLRGSASDSATQPEQRVELGSSSVGSDGGSSPSDADDEEDDGAAAQLCGEEEDWCETATAFAELFDSNDPAQMQQAVDLYGAWKDKEDGIKVGVTKGYYYKMYHGNVKKVLKKYIGAGYFAWSFASKFEQPAALNGDHDEEADADAETITLVRDGTITMNLGWGMRQMFWNAVVKGLPDGEVFPYSHVDEFSDCHACASKLVLRLRKDEELGWKITAISIVKLA